MTGVPGRIIVAGGGIAGLSAALCLAAHGFPSKVYERAPRFDAVGAGIQLSPNATRILARLGVLDRLGQAAVNPEAVVLRDSRRLVERARISLGASAERRWGAPYLVLHRADLQRALAAAARDSRHIVLAAGAEATAAFGEDGPALRIARDGGQEQARGPLIVGADGVNSAVRAALQARSAGRFTGKLAWRATIPSELRRAQNLLPPDQVSVFLHGGMHLVAYPVSAGRELNLVAVARGSERQSEAEGSLPPFAGVAAELEALLAAAGPWTAWPVRTVDPRGPWTDPCGLALIGDAAHAMTPYAAQGAAMAIEDAAVLAGCLAEMPVVDALERYEALRRPRVTKVIRRGMLNELAWHAAGPVALARNVVLALRGPRRLAADLDWLYGWRGER